MPMKNPNDIPLLIFDGACGTTIQTMHLPKSAWETHEGCNEFLNLSAPDAIVEMHRRFLDAGATVIETNSFGANSIVLSEYNLQDKTEAINKAAARNAQEARKEFPKAFIAGSIGPTTKLPTLGQIPVETLADSFRVQIRSLMETGVDLLIIETVQDLLQLKTALITAHEVFHDLNHEVPIMASITVERTGTMLIGTEVAAVAATLEPFDLFSLGLNCATGPDLMASHLHLLSNTMQCRISCIPNAGIPETKGDQVIYPLQPQPFADYLKEYIEEYGVSIVGGCCGTTPDHIRALAQTVNNVVPGKRKPESKPAVSSGFVAAEIQQDIPPFLIGERTNVNGSKKFRELILADDFDGALAIGLQQQENGAHAVDLCTAYAGRDEQKDLTTMVKLFAQSVKAPLVVDSTQAECIESSLKNYPGRCIVNSINLEDGGKNLEKVCTLVKKYGAAVIALTINEKGMAMTIEDKVETAKAIYRLAVEKHGLRPEDLLFDVLTFTIGSGDTTLQDAAYNTIEAIRKVKEKLPGVSTSLGVSNISFGLLRQSRKFLNSVFLHEAIEAGLDAAIIDPAKVIPLARMDEEDRRVCMDLIYNRKSDEVPSPLEQFINHFSEAAQDESEEKDSGKEVIPEVALADKIMKGDKNGIEDLLSILMGRMTPVSIVNTHLVPAMRRVGEMFGRGEMLLPFVLKSAETMKACVKYLEPFMESTEQESSVKVLLATVQGDVHDIGKNLVDIILSNNGYKVFNIGTKVPAEVIIEKAKEHDVDVIGLSGLLVKSALVMRDNMEQFQEAGLTAPILLGGAALTKKFVAESCVPNYTAPVVYCSDAFAGLTALQQIEEGTLKPTTVEVASESKKMKPGAKNEHIRRDVKIPSPPFRGTKVIADINTETLLEYINTQALFRGRWGYRRGSMSAEEYKKMIEEKVAPLYESLRKRLIDEKLARPAVSYGYFNCNSKGDSLEIQSNGKNYELTFPRQADPPHLCIADYFKPAGEGTDVVGFFVVTMGPAISEATKELYESDQYHDYLMLHALSVELTDALAEYWHEVMRTEMGINTQKPNDILGYAVQDYQGSRYGFGYPSCPDLEAHKVVFELLEPENIGVELTENMEMVPEQSTSALVAHHPQAKYFAV
ncbi:MAG: methionine synthase [Chitinivibrionales bacterium]|nr:methionine synthase [Chitinivibrionales bacterium]